MATKALTEVEAARDGSHADRERLAREFEQEPGGAGQNMADLLRLWSIVDRQGHQKVERWLRTYRTPQPGV